MVANLSLVFDDACEVRCDLLKNVPISAIDQYTMEKEGSEDIRREYRDKIRYFKEVNKQELARLNNFRGSIVIVYHDENHSNRHYRLRVLYKKQKNKKNPSYVLKEMIKLLKKQEDPYLTIDMIEFHRFMFGSEFAYYELERAKRKFATSSKIKPANDFLIDRIVKDTCQRMLQQDKERGYFYLRKLDSYLERKKGLTVTPLVLTEKDMDSVSSVRPSSVIPNVSHSFVSMSDVALTFSEEHSMHEGGLLPPDEEEEIILKKERIPRKQQEKTTTSDFYQEELLNQIIQEYLLRGERVSMSEIDLEYRTRLEEMEASLEDKPKQYRLGAK